MEKIIKETKRLIETIEKQVIYICDRCGVEIQDPKKFGSEAFYIELTESLNLPDCENDYIKYELCENCFQHIKNLIKLEIIDYEPTN